MFMISQLKDLRSAVQKEACRLLSIAAEKFQKNFESLAGRFITKDSLLTIINSGNKLLSENAHSCVLSIIEFCPSAVYLPAFLEESTSKSQQVRSKVSLYLSFILEDLSPQQIDKHIAQLDSIILKCVQDAHPEVRQNFRSVFATYNRLYPQKASKILAAVDLSIKKLLQDEIKSSGTISRENNSNYTPAAVAAGSQDLSKTSKQQSQSQSQQQSQDDSNNHFHFSSASQVQAPPLPQQQLPLNKQQQNILVTSQTTKAKSSGSSHQINQEEYYASKTLLNSNSIKQSQVSESPDPMQRAQNQLQNKPQSNRNQQSPLRSKNQSSQNGLYLSKNIRQNNHIDTFDAHNKSESPEVNVKQQHPASRSMNAYRSSDHLQRSSVEPQQKTLPLSAKSNSLFKSMKSADEVQVAKYNKTNSHANNNENEYKPVIRRESLHKQRLVDLDEDNYELYNRRNSNNSQDNQSEEEQSHQQINLRKKEHEIYEVTHDNYQDIDDYDDHQNDDGSNDGSSNRQIANNHNNGRFQTNGVSNKWVEEQVEEVIEDPGQWRGKHIALPSPMRQQQNVRKEQQVSLTTPVAKMPVKQQNNNYLVNAAPVAASSTTSANERKSVSPAPNSIMKAQQKASNVEPSLGMYASKTQPYFAQKVVVQEEEVVQQQLYGSSQLMKGKNASAVTVGQQNVKTYAMKSNGGQQAQDTSNYTTTTTATTPNTVSQKNGGSMSMTSNSNNNAGTADAWREEDVELLLEKISTNKSWSTRASAFDSLKEIISEIGGNGNEKLSSALMKRIVNVHIECLSDSHFKVIGACLDSLIAIMSFDSSYILPKLDNLIFKVLNNLIDTKDVVSSRANFLVNVISKIFPAEKLIEPIQKVLEQTNKSLLKVCSLEVLMVTVKGAEEYYSLISNVRHTVQLMCLLISENPTQKQITLPCLGIILALRDHNWQGTLHSILSLSNQNQISELRNISYEFAPDLDEDLRKYAQKESQKPADKADKLAKVNGKQFSVEPYSSLTQSVTPSSESQSQQQQQQPFINTSMKSSLSQKSKQMLQIPTAAVSNSIGNSQISTNKTSNQSPSKTPPVQFDLQNLDDIAACVADFDGNEPFIVQQINLILLSTIGFFKQNNRKSKESALRVLSSLFHRNYFFLTIQPNTVFECLNIYPHIPKDMDFYQVDELIDEMIDCVPHLIFMKALVEKLNSEKPPHLQIMIKKISFILRKARKEEIRPFLDHIIDSFKLQINDQSPDVRKSVVFCLVDLKFLMKDEIDPYLHQFTVNQQKLVEIYIDKRAKSLNQNNQYED